MQATFIVLSAIVLAAAAFPENYIPIVSKSEIHHPDGAYQLNYLTADGQAFSDNAKSVRNADNTGDVLVRSGHYAYTAPDGTPIALSYVADESGFRVAGSHVPTPVPVPAAQPQF
ncbi:hypothetical protein M8J76_010581 [Diaphorina citri]|nr:hypothetical protein M8J75_005658 [Diaphorina citri]KAI5733330.1 hypothetical protein M8J76_010581 [Diaphorina citri]